MRKQPAKLKPKKLQQKVDLPEKKEVNLVLPENLGEKFDLERSSSLQWRYLCNVTGCGFLLRKPNSSYRKCRMPKWKADMLISVLFKVLLSLKDGSFKWFYQPFNRFFRLFTQSKGRFARALFFAIKKLKPNIWVPLCRHPFVENKNFPDFHPRGVIVQKAVIPPQVLKSLDISARGPAMRSLISESVSLKAQQFELISVANH